eukprot:236627_1
MKLLLLTMIITAVAVYQINASPPRTLLERHLFGYESPKTGKYSIDTSSYESPKTGKYSTNTHTTDANITSWSIFVMRICAIIFIVIVVFSFGYLCYDYTRIQKDQTKIIQELKVNNQMENVMSNKTSSAGSASIFELDEYVNA